MKFKILVLIIFSVFSFVYGVETYDVYQPQIQAYGFRLIRGSEQVVFKDSKLENAIRDIIGKSTGPITKFDAGKVTELNLKGKGISSLEGIEVFINLERLNISNNNITDISPLESVLKRGLKEFVVSGNPLTIKDLGKLDEWSGSDSSMELHRQLVDWGFRLITAEGETSLYTNGIYKVKETNGYITEVLIDENIILNDSKASLEIDNVSLEGDNLILSAREKEVVIVTPDGLETRESLAEKMANEDNTEPIFFSTEQYIAVMQDRTEEEIESINKQIKDFVLKKMNTYGVIDISEPVVITSESGRSRTVKFDVTTDTGDMTIYFRPVKDKLEGQRFEKASEIGLAPASKYITLGNRGYIVTEHFEGTELMDILWKKPQVLFENYQWIFEELGRKIGILDKNELLYKDIIRFNTYVNLETHEIAILDYEIAIAGRRRPVKQIRRLIEYLDEHINISSDTKEEMLNIFNRAYSEALNNPD